MILQLLSAAVLIMYYLILEQVQVKVSVPQHLIGDVVLGYEYMFDDSDDERRENGYLSELYDDVDPIEEFVYRAAEWANNYE